MHAVFTQYHQAIGAVETTRKFGVYGGKEMTSSFAASLRKLAEDAAEAKRLAEAKVREAEMLAKAEALRIKRQEEAAERKKARDARIQAEREQREIAANAERIRREAAAAKQAEQKRIAAEKLRIETEERLRREEAERLRLRELRLSELCTDIYGGLAVAAWDGKQEVAVEDEAFDVKSELLPLGLAVNRRNKLARLASSALVEFLGAVDDFLPFADTSKDQDIAVRLRDLGGRLGRNGQLKLVAQLSKLSAQIVAQSENECSRAERAYTKLLNSIDGEESSIAEIESEILRIRPLLAKEKKEQNARSGQYMAVVEKLKVHIDDIGTSYHAHLPQGIRPEHLSLETKADALRLAYRASVQGVDFESFSVLEIINLIRSAKELSPFEASPRAEPGYWDELWRLNSIVSDLDRRLDRMNAEFAAKKANLTSMHREAKQASKNLRSATEFLTRAQSFHNSCTEFERVLGRSLEGVDANQLGFDGDQYIGPAIACLAELNHVENLDVKSAYAELRWLMSDAGRDFAGYMDIVLSELAKEGARSVELTIAEIGAENKVEIGKVSLVCKIGSALMGLLFSKRGINVVEVPNGDGPTKFGLSW